MSVNHGTNMFNFANSLFPITRSITGEGVRETLALIQSAISVDMSVHSVPSGSKVFDWTVPKEWAIHEAYIEDDKFNHIIDIKENNLHVLGYSTPVDEWVEYDELLKHIYTQEDNPDAIPYVTSYYKERYGFCMSENQKKFLSPGKKYHMYIDSKLFDGELNYGEVIIPGESGEEIFFSTYICHPSMANNECSGPALSVELINYISAKENRKYTYRFVFIPETIGSITYLSRNFKSLKKNMIAGFNLSCVGDNNDYSIVESRYADTLADKVLKNVLSYKEHYTTYSFLKQGSDERQYNAPGIELPVVCFCRSKYGEFPEYHTSLDNMSFVSSEGFEGSFEVMSDVVDILEANFYPLVTVLCEPQLGKRGLYPSISKKGQYDAIYSMTNFITYSDGKNDLIDISNRINVPVKVILSIAAPLIENGLIARNNDKTH